VPSLTEGGALWFTDLTLPDPHYVLPVLASLTFLATVELGAADGMDGQVRVYLVARVFSASSSSRCCHCPTLELSLHACCMRTFS
jgi:hypothetical protein